MESVNELREYAGLMTEGSTARLRLLKLADNIVTEHEKELRKQYDKGYSAGYDAGYDVGFSSYDDMCAEHGDSLEEHGWVKLPLDADGVPIRVGDDMETLMVGHEGDHSPVEWVSLTADGWNVDGEPPTSMRHYQPPTVESTLREFADVVRKERVELAPISEETIAEYAPKFRLAGDGE